VRRSYPLIVIFAATATATATALCACDPGYWIGARLRLGPATDSCVLSSVRHSFGRERFEGIDLRHGSYVGITIPDSGAPWWQNARLLLKSQRDSMLLEVTTFWLGAAGTVPLDQQHSFVAAATSVLDGVRTACAPDSSARVECLARGFGGRPACEGLT
jgi:hypothetical protein